MHDVIGYLVSHPLTTMAGALILLLIFYFLLKQLIKVSFVLLTVAILAGGYLYYKYPATAPEKIQEALHATRLKSERVMERGKQIYREGKGFYEKGKKLTKEAGNYFQDKEEKKTP